MQFRAIDKRLEGHTTLRQVQLTELYLLEVFDEICKKYNLRYFLIYGTLLGCLRHKGFIPWDDDLDVGMPIEDYQKFIRIAPKILPQNLMLQTSATVPGCFEMFAKIRDLSSLALEVHSDVTRPCGIYIDIFPYEKFPLITYRLRRLFMKGLSLTWRRSRLHRVANHRFLIGVFYSGIKACLWTFVHAILRCLLYLLSKVLPTAWYVLPEAGCASSSQEFHEDDLFPLREEMFEGKAYPVPNSASKWLSAIYGEWTKLPPPEERCGHHSNIFYPIQTMGFWWTVPHISLSKAEAERINHVAEYLVKI